MRLRTALLSSSLLSAVLMAASSGAALANSIVGPYVSLGAGYTLEQDQLTHFSPFSYSDGTPGGSKSSYRFGDGFDGETSFGYGLGNGVRIEVEGAFLENNVNHRAYTPFPGVTTGHDERYGGFINALYDLDLAQFGLALPVTPYVGVGGGYLWDHLSPFTTAYDNAINTNRVGGTEGSAAYQGIVGVAFDVTEIPGLAVTGEYRLVGTLPRETGSSFSSTAFDAAGIHKGSAGFNDNYSHSFMVGLRYAFDTALPPPPPVVAAPPPAPAPARTYLVFFDWDKSDLSGRAREIIAEAAQASTRVQTTRIEVNGYTDNSAVHPGPRGEKYNLALSIKRADSVKAELVRDGVPETAIETMGFGETHPLVPTGPNTREPQNRRVEIILH